MVGTEGLLLVHLVLAAMCVVLLLRQQQGAVRGGQMIQLGCLMVRSHRCWQGRLQQVLHLVLALPLPELQVAVPLLQAFLGPLLALAGRMQPLLLLLPGLLQGIPPAPVHNMALVS